jgi:benzoyl-CoA reductase subunit C
VPLTGATRPSSDPAPVSFDDRTCDGLLASVRQLVEDASYPTVRAWRDRGGKVVGHYQVYFPEEIAHAAGMLPVKICGARIEARTAEARFGSYLCSILKTSLELALSGRLELDLFVSHPICDAARNLAAIWGRNTPTPSHILYLPQNAASPAAVGYLRDEYDRIRRVIEEIGGRAVTDDDLRRSIAIFNENRRLLRQLYELRRETPWRLSVAESYVLVAAGGVMPREEHNALLARALALLETRDAMPQDRMRIVFDGGFCEQPPLDLLRTIGDFCYVVDDDLLIGLRWILSDVDASGDPLAGLARAYVDQSSFSPVQRDPRKPKEHMLLERIRAARADAAILSAAKMCEPGLDEQVAYTRMLEREGIPYFVTEFEERMSSFEHLQMQLETFVENVLFAGAP